MPMIQSLGLARLKCCFDRLIALLHAHAHRCTGTPVLDLHVPTGTLVPVQCTECAKEAVAEGHEGTVAANGCREII